MGNGDQEFGRDGCGLVTDMRDVVGKLSAGRRQGDVLGAVSAISLM
jgi:hypothetical protein